MLVVQLARAQECKQYQFDVPFFPGTSCEDIYNKNPQSREVSGYYWILDGPSRVYCGMSFTDSSCERIYLNNEITRDKSGYYRINNKWVFCDMNAILNLITRGDLMLSCAGMNGVWKRISHFNTTAGDDCPSPWVKSSHNGVNFCKVPTTVASCYSVIYSTNGVSYQEVCGRASAYQKGTPDGFLNRDAGIDSFYVDGISITHGKPRQHIWTYAVGVSASGNYPNHNCPCATPSGLDPPDFVGSNYHCESGTESTIAFGAFYLSDILWDGEGCPSAGNTCCSSSNLPWFHHQLNQSTQDDIETRICTDQEFDDEAILITNLELYIQ